MEKKKLKKGIFVAFEGIDKSGKTYHLKILADKLESIGYPIFRTREPGSPHSKVCMKIRDILMDKENVEIVPETEMGLFEADRAQHIGEPGLVADQLKKGMLVMSDRQWASTKAFQVYGRQMYNHNCDFFKAMNTFFAQGYYPHLNILIDLDPEVALSRDRHEKDMTRFDVETLAFHRRVRKGYFELVKQRPEKWLVVESNRPKEEVVRDIFLEFNKWLAKFL